jgi:hypothetical protein
MIALHALVLSGAVLQVAEQNTDDMPQTGKGKSWVPLVDGPPVDTSIVGNPHTVTSTTYDATGNPVIRTQVTRDMTPEEFPLTGPEFFTLIKGLPAQHKTTIRTKVTDALNAPAPADTLTDQQYRDAKRQKKAAVFLSDEASDKPYGDVLTAFGVLLITMTNGQLTNFRQRWVLVGSIG